ncbi:hypothetical protein E4U43_008175 [Claviceps pusilla]|uniref:Uncharacterized protein n=1 Tax=Claviceps pusilla TaxID=123648 RepID=A0A9P7ND78_9HYPO|nr:hypothetical protein E4U43_008175 [Claviceps pusilla]
MYYTAYIKYVVCTIQLRDIGTEEGVEPLQKCYRVRVLQDEDEQQDEKKEPGETPGPTEFKDTIWDFSAGMQRLTCPGLAYPMPGGRTT